MASLAAIAVALCSTTAIAQLRPGEGPPGDRRGTNGTNGTNGTSSAAGTRPSPLRGVLSTKEENYGWLVLIYIVVMCVSLGLFALGLSAGIDMSKDLLGAAR